VLLAEESSHVLVYEYGGVAAHAGLMARGLPGIAGRITSEQVLSESAPSMKGADQRVAVVSLENTHNNAGGRVWPLDELDDVASTARELELAVHLDGARLLNAATAQGVEPSVIASRFDTVTLCLSKGLGCPLGALLAGSRDLIDRAWREKHLFGGAMRQSGIVAAAGLYALDHHVARLADDHARARRLAEALHSDGLAVEPEQVETNFVQLDLLPLGLLRDVSATIRPSVLRAVTHLGLSDEDIERAAELVPRALRVGVSV
jgi:threonine aldolase